jgi:hypothetical protein
MVIIHHLHLSDCLKGSWFREKRWVTIFTVVGHKSGTLAIDIHFHFERAICH